jgi:hypothetical protein
MNEPEFLDVEFFVRHKGALRVGITVELIVDFRDGKWRVTAADWPQAEGDTKNEAILNWLKLRLAA